MNKEEQDLINIKTDLAILKAKVKWMENKIQLLDLKFYAFSVRKKFIRTLLKYWPVVLIFALIFFALGVVHDKKVFLSLLGSAVGS